MDVSTQGRQVLQALHILLKKNKTNNLPHQIFKRMQLSGPKILNASSIGFNPVESLPPFVHQHAFDPEKFLRLAKA